MKLNRITPELIVKNIEETVDFYDKLGFELTNRVGEEKMEWANMMWPKSEVGLMFMTPESMGKEIAEFKTLPIRASVVQFIEMDDLDEFYEKAKIVGEIVQEKHETFYGTKEFSM